MSTIKIKDIKKPKPVTHQQAVEIWLVLNAETEPKDNRQRDFVSRVERISIGYYKADTPLSYVEAHIQPAIVSFNNTCGSVNQDGSEALDRLYVYGSTMNLYKKLRKLGYVDNFRYTDKGSVLLRQSMLDPFV